MNLDAATITAAARASITPLGRMLREQEGEHPTNPGQQLASAMENAGIPDCVRPDALKHASVRLGGILDLPVLGYAAITNKCK